MPARRLQLAVDPPQLVVHPVHVHGQRAQLVAVRHVQVAGEVAGRNLPQTGLGVLDGAGQRPRQDEAEQQGEEDGSRRDTDEQVSRALVGAAVLGDQGVRLVRCRLGQLPGGDLEIHGQCLGTRVEGERLRLRVGDLRDRRLHVRVVPLQLTKRRSLVGLRLEAQLRGRPEQGEHGVDRLLHRLQARRRGSCRRLATVQPLRVVGRARTQRQQLAKNGGVRVELRIAGDSYLQGAEALRARVRLAEDTEPEQRDQNEERRDAEEGDEQLRPHLRGDAGDGPGERVVRAAQQPPGLPDGCRDPTCGRSSTQCLTAGA